jgi:hypothetical protein
MKDIQQVECFTFPLYIHVTHLSLQKRCYLFFMSTIEKLFHIHVVSRNYAPNYILAVSSRGRGMNQTWVNEKITLKIYEIFWHLPFAFFIYRAPASPFSPRNLMHTQFIHEWMAEREKEKSIQLIDTIFKRLYVN